MAALTAAVLACAGSGDRVVLPSDGYYTTRLLAAEELERFGIEVSYVADAGDRGVRRGRRAGRRRLVLLETPSNPLLDVCDIAAVARAARAAGALVAVDNTTATPLGQRPLALGAHMTVGSDTKALTGHSDLLLGHVSVTDDELFARVKGFRDRTGSTPGPFEAWLGHRSMSTLDLRLARQAANAAAVSRGAGRARRRSPASGGRGAPGDPSFALASAQMLRPNGVVSAELADEAAVARAAVGHPAVDGGDQLRRRAQHRRPPGAVGRGRGRARVRPVLLRHRGHRRPGRGPVSRPGRPRLTPSAAPGRRGPSSRS